MVLNTNAERKKTAVPLEIWPGRESKSVFSAMDDGGAKSRERASRLSCEKAKETLCFGDCLLEGVERLRANA